MKTRYCGFAFVAAIGLSIASPAFPQRAGETGEYKNSESHESAVKRGIARRIQRANEHLEHAAEKSLPDQNQSALLSLASPIDLEQVREIVRDCECEVTQLQKTIGEFQLAIPTDNHHMFTQTFESEFKGELISILEFRITTLEANRKMEAPPIARHYSSQEYALVSKALAEL